MIMPGYGTAIGAIAGGLIGAFGSGASKNVQQRGLTLGPYTGGQQQFLEQGKNIGDVSRLLGEANKIDNLKYRQQAAQFAPNLFGNIAQNATNTSDMLSGNLTQGIQDTIGKPGATGRDLGLTPYQLQLRGANRVGIEGDTARKLTPFNETAMDTLISPAALQQRQDQLDTQNNQILNQSKLMAAGASNTNPLGSGLAAGLGAFGNLRGYGTIGGGQMFDGQYYQNSGTPGTSQFGNDFYQQFGAEGDNASGWTSSGGSDYG
jgi:hypothetical protein